MSAVPRFQCGGPVPQGRDWVRIHGAGREIQRGVHFVLVRPSRVEGCRHRYIHGVPSHTGQLFWLNVIVSAAIFFLFLWQQLPHLGIYMTAFVHVVP